MITPEEDAIREAEDAVRDGKALPLGDRALLVRAGDNPIRTALVEVGGHLYRKVGFPVDRAIYPVTGREWMWVLVQSERSRAGVLNLTPLVAHGFKEGQWVRFKLLEDGRGDYLGPADPFLYYQSEHPEIAAGVPDSLVDALQGAGFEDRAWHNDSCIILHCRERGLLATIDYPQFELRELGDAWFSCWKIKFDADEGPMWEETQESDELFKGEDPAAFEEWVRALP